LKLSSKDTDLETNISYYLRSREFNDAIINTARALPEGSILSDPNYAQILDDILNNGHIYQKSISMYNDSISVLII
jgi:hypothetical protein